MMQRKFLDENQRGRAEKLEAFAEMYKQKSLLLVDKKKSLLHDYKTGKLVNLETILNRVIGRPHLSVTIDGNSQALQESDD